MKRSAFFPVVLLLATLALSVGCSDSTSLDPLGPTGPDLSISDAVHGANGNDNFYWLPPMVSNPSPTGVFDGSQSPTVTICLLDGGACDATQPSGFPLEYTLTSGPGGEVIAVSTTDEHYRVNWHTDVAPLDIDEFYRIAVSVGSQVLGHADIDPVNTGKELKNVDTNEFIGLKDGRTLPIKFRIEEGAINAFCSDPDIAACWSFDEGAGQVAADASGNGNDGRLGSATGPDANDPIFIPGKFGSALQFSSDYVFVANDASLEPTHLSIETWIRRSGFPGPVRYPVVKGGNGCSHAGYELLTFGAGNLHLGFHTVSATTNFSPGSGPGIWDGQWHHVVGTYDEQSIRFYVDGVEVGSGTPLTEPLLYNLPTHNDLYLGAYVGGCFLPFNGDLDDVVIWRRALTPAEVAQRAAR